MKKILNSFIFANGKFTNIFYACLFVVLYDYVWKEYCVPIWTAYHYKDVAHPMFYEFIGYAIAIIPSVYYRGVRNISSWISLILYYFGYVPIILATLYNFEEGSDYEIWCYWIVLCLFMCLYFRADRNERKIILNTRNQTWPITYVYVFIAVSVLIQLALYHGNIRIADFHEIYELREQNSKIGGGLFDYINAWSGTFTYPFLICYGLCKNNKIHIAIGSALMFFSFCIFGLKVHLFAPLIILALYRFLSWQQTSNFNLMSIFTIGIAILSLLLMYNLDNPTCYTLAAVFLMRTLTISGCLFAGYYLPFFHTHPYTYFTHINIINFIFDANPYAGTAIGNVVSEGGMNANAIFWAMDGVTGGGVIGVFIVSLCFLIFLHIINALSSGANKKFVCILMVMPTMALLNVSFFTFLLSEGVLLIVLCLFKVKLKLPFDGK